MITKDRQYKSFNFERREKTEDGKMIVTGNPIVFNRETVIWEYDGVQYKEVIDAKALDSADMGDVVLNIDHCGKPAAKTKNNTLTFDKRIDGLYIEADLSQNATGRELYEDIDNGFYDKMSFAFTTEEDSYNRDTHTRTILKIAKVYDVSAVTFPAYEQTSISARSWAEAQHEIEVAEATAAEASQRDAEATQLELYKLKNRILGGI
ncbi:MAG: phage prohead protease, family [Firmicutes bacterium]|nr:phage prohead protease, family [Bacillota bacterium]